MLGVALPLLAGGATTGPAEQGSSEEASAEAESERVPVGYGEQEKEDLTGSVSSVTPNENEDVERTWTCRGSFGERRLTPVHAPVRPSMSDASKIAPQNVDYHEIARRGDTEVMEAFLDAGLEPDLTNARGHTLLMIAAYNEQPAMVKLLAKRGADVDQPDASGNTPLMGCAFQGFEDVAALLLDRGADVEYANGAGATALMFAAMYRQPALVDLLLERGADPERADERGRTAADLAEEHGHEAIAERLREAQPTSPPSSA